MKLAPADARAALSRPDAVLESDAFAMVLAVIKGGDSPDQVIASLTKDFPNMGEQCNLLMDWMRLAGVTRETVDEVVRQSLSKLLMERFTDREADRVWDMWKREPEWVAKLLEDAHWRKIMQKLAVDHPDCRFLQFMLTRAMDVKSGGVDEVDSGAVDTGLLSLPPLELFLQQLFRRMKAVLQCGVVWPGCPVLKSFVSELTIGEVEYVAARTLLMDFEREVGPTVQGGAYLNQMIIMLDEAATTICPGTRRLAVALDGGLAYGDLADSLLNVVCSASSPSPPDVRRVKDSLQRMDNGTVPRFVMRSPLLQLLLQQLFRPTARALAKQFVKDYATVCVACASGVYPQDDSDVKLVIEAHGLVRDSPVGAQLERRWPDIQRCLSGSVVAAYGLLTWAMTVVGTAETFLKKQYTLCSVVAHIPEAVVREWPHLRWLCLEVHMLCLSTVQSLNNLERDDTEACAAVKDAVSGAAAIVCLCGEDAHLALDRCCKTIETLPSTLLNGCATCFLSSLLERVAPPFSQEFSSALDQIMLIGSLRQDSLLPCGKTCGALMGMKTDVP